MYSKLDSFEAWDNEMFMDVQAHDTYVDLLHLSGDRLADVKWLDDFFDAMKSNEHLLTGSHDDGLYLVKSLFINVVVSSCKRGDIKICPLCFSASDVYAVLDKADLMAMSGVFRPYPEVDEVQGLSAAAQECATERQSTTAATPFGLPSGHPSPGLQARGLRAGSFVIGDPR